MSDIEIIFICTYIIIILIVFLVWNYFHNKKLYEETTYFQNTNIPYSQIRHDLGHNGEYLIYKILKNLEQEGAKFLFNLYIPTYNNKTTEIDVIMITYRGIFVFESKNYSGWIFGTESQKRWTQSLHIGYGDTQKEHFYNPIMQNEYHIKYLNKLLGTQYKYHSIIVFSNDCEFKKIIRNPNSNSYLIYRCESYKTVQNIMAFQTITLSSEDILNIKSVRGTSPLTTQQPIKLGANA